MEEEGRRREDFIKHSARKLEEKASSTAESTVLDRWSRPPAMSSHISVKQSLIAASPNIANKTSSPLVSSNTVNRTGERLKTSFSDLKRSFLNLQDEHSHIVSVFEESLKERGSPRSELILFNYFEKLFDRLSLSLEKENEIKGLILQIDDKLDGSRDKSADFKLER